MRLTPPSKAGGKAKTTDDSSAALFSAEDLAGMLANKLELATMFEEQATRVGESTPARAFGTALNAHIKDQMSQNKNSTTFLGKGMQKQCIKDIYRDSDANGDGAIQPIELRQLIRNKLKQMENKEIDDFFTADTQRSGNDLAHFTNACQSALDAAEEAKSEAHDLVQAATRARAGRGVRGGIECDARSRGGAGGARAPGRGRHPTQTPRPPS